MYERFTDRARKVLQLANQEAHRFNHEYIGTEHILLGLINEGHGLAANVLKILGIELSKVRSEVEKIVQAGPENVVKGKLPQTPRAKKVIEYSIEEARNLNHNYVGTEHVLLGLIRDQDNVAAQVLLNVGLKLADVRKEIILLLAHTADLPMNAGEEPPNTRYPDVPDAIRQELEGLDALVEQMQGQMEGAISKQDFHGAASFRIERDKLKKRRAVLLQSAANPARPAQTDARRSFEHSLFDYSEYATFPADTRRQLLKLDAEILRLTSEKEAAVAEQDFEKAASLRDQADKVMKEWQQLIREAQAAHRREPVNEYDLFLAFEHADGAAIPDNVLADLRQQLAARFGGFSEHREEVSGEMKVGWVSFRGSVLVFRVFAEELLHPRDFFKTLIQQLGEERRIEQVAVIERKVEVL